MAELFPISTRILLPPGATVGSVRIEYPEPYLVGARSAGGRFDGIAQRIDGQWAELREAVDGAALKVYGGELGDRMPPLVKVTITPTGPGVRAVPIIHEGHPRDTGGGGWNLSAIGEDHDRIATEQQVEALDGLLARASDIVDRAELNALVPLGPWEPGLLARRGSIVTHLNTVFRALQDNTGVEPFPDGNSDIWEVFVPRGATGLPGVPGSVNGLTSDQLLVYPGAGIPNGEDPPSSWPRGAVIADLQDGRPKNYPFSYAKILSVRDRVNGSTSQLALVWSGTDGRPEMWVRGARDVVDEFTVWRKGGGAEGALLFTSLVNANKLVNGSGELGTFGWTQYGPTTRRLGFRGAHEAESGPLLEISGAGGALTAFEGVNQSVPIWMASGDQWYVTVALSVTSVYPVLKVMERNTGHERVRYEQPLGPGINTVGPFGAGNGAQGGTLEVNLYYPPNTVSDGLLCRFRASVGYGQASVADPRTSVRAFWDDYQAFKATGGTAQLAQGSLSSTAPPSSYPEGLSYLPVAGFGWPFPGVIETVRPRTASDPTATRQTIRQTGGTGLQQRTALAAAPWWTAWTPYGEKGVRGTKWFFGVGRPADATTLTDVLPGDLYQEQLTGDVYVRGATSWPATPAYNNKGVTGVSSYTRERRTGGTPGCLHVLINNVWVVASPANTKLELDSWGVLGSDGVMYGPGAEAVVDALGFLPGKFYYLGYPSNGKNLFPFDGVMPVDALATQAQRQFSPCSTPRGVSNRLFLNPAAEPIDVEPVSQLYRVTPLMYPYDTDLGPNGLNKIARNIDQPPAGQTSGGGYSLRVRADNDTGQTNQNTVGQPSPHVDGSGRRVFIRASEANNTLHAYTPTEWPETDDGDLLVAFQHNNVALGRPGIQFVATGNHTAPSLYLIEFTGTTMGLRKRTTTNGTVSEVAIGATVSKALANYQIMLARVRRQGASIQARAWLAPDGWHLPNAANLQEPTTWDLERADTSIPGSGVWGMYERTDFLRVHAMSLATLDGKASF